ncbi:MAG TPA: MaoC/PaaZ C-terminal domain-containing protein [Polyangiaceae bacterium]|nr:MaoC/PaaZ C-terminal domain-containing protein [Polyangiaceae bacterium]
MAPLTRHIVHQHRVIASLSGVALRGLLQRFEREPRVLEPLPGPEFHATCAPPPAALIQDYVRAVGGDPRAYVRTIPAHLFPQWGLPLAAQTLRKLPYPLLRVLNGGCRLEINAPLAADEPLLLRARLESVDDDGRRAVLHQRIVTGQRSQPDAVVAHVYAIVPSASRNGGGDRARKPREEHLVPSSAQKLASLSLNRKAGLDFALLTGDFNPIHWVAPYARALGYKGSILHGFSSMAHAFEILQRELFGGATDAIGMVDVRFVRPLVLPAAIGVYARGNEFFLGSREKPAFLTGSYSTQDAARGSAAASNVKTRELSN